MGGEMESLVVRLPRYVLEGLRKWSDDEDRTMAQQVRRLIRQSMPVKYIRPEQSHVCGFVVCPHDFDEIR